MTGNKNRRILIVDDNVAIHEDFRKVIGTDDAGASAIDQSAASLFGEPAAAASCPSASYKLDSAYQGQEALARVEQSLSEGRPYAMAFVDVRMPPGWDGVETVRRIWEVDPDLQIVICTAYSDYSWGDMTRVLGETDRLLLLKKPFDNVEVRQLASALTEKWQLTREARQSVDQLQRLVDERTASLWKANQQLLQAQKLEAVGQLAAGIAPEINNSTQYVGDNAHFLKGAFRNLEAVLDECDRLVQAAKSDSISAEMAAAFERAVARTDLDFLREEIPKAIDQSLDSIDRVAEIVRSMSDSSHPDSARFTTVDVVNSKPRIAPDQGTLATRGRGLLAGPADMRLGAES
ncbi:MAG TPA: response regulator [Pirellulales bacterium]|jgi:two-component system NtrC family sensor kinase|nr:response regulator [Pirellulales bacterium]